MSKLIQVFITTFLWVFTVALVLGSLGAGYGFLLLLLFGILHLHVFPSLPAIGWWVAWPLGVFWTVFFGSKVQDNISASTKKEKK